MADRDVIQAALDINFAFDLIGVPATPNLVARAEWLSDHAAILKPAVSTAIAVCAIEQLARRSDPCWDEVPF